MSRTVVQNVDLRQHFSEVNRLVPVRVVTVVPGVEYYGKVLSVGTDHVVLEAEFHVVTVALAHVVSTHREPFGLLATENRNFTRATARTLSTDVPAAGRSEGGDQSRPPSAARPPRAWHAWLPRRS